MLQICYSVCYSVCYRYVTDMLHLSYRYLTDILQISYRYLTYTLQIYVTDLLQICYWYVTDMLQLCYRETYVTRSSGRIGRGVAARSSSRRPSSAPGARRRDTAARRACPSCETASMGSQWQWVNLNNPYLTTWRTRSRKRDSAKKRHRPRPRKMSKKTSQENSQRKRKGPLRFVIIIGRRIK